jgi:hypothetical protein
MADSEPSPDSVVIAAVRSRKKGSDDADELEFIVRYDGKIADLTVSFDPPLTGRPPEREHERKRVEADILRIAAVLTRFGGTPGAIQFRHTPL